MDSRRKSYLIDYVFQFKLAFFIVVILIISNILYPFIIAHIFSSEFQIVRENMPELSQKIEKSQSELLQIVILWQLCLIAISFIFSIILGHKIVGPIFKIKKHFTDAHTSDFIPISLRDGDYFYDLANTLNKTMLAKQLSLKTLQEQGEFLNSLRRILHPNDQTKLDQFLTILKKVSF